MRRLKRRYGRARRGKSPLTPWVKTPGGLGIMASDERGNEYVVGTLGPAHLVNFNGRTMAVAKSVVQGKNVAYGMAIAQRHSPFKEPLP